MTIYRNIQRIIIEKVTQLFVYFINDKICVPKEISNLILGFHNAVLFL